MNHSTGTSGGIRHSHTGAAWRQPWFWFVMAPPIAAVVLGVSLVTIAVTQGDSRVVDNYYQAGKSIHKDFALERRAAELGLEASIAVDRQDGRINLHLSGSHAAPDTLRLRLNHATHAERDRQVELVADASGLYRGRIGQSLQGRHYLRLEPLDGEWRLTSVLDNGQDRVDLPLPGQDG